MAMRRVVFYFRDEQEELEGQRHADSQDHREPAGVGLKVARSAHQLMRCSSEDLRLAHQPVDTFPQL